MSDLFLGIDSSTQGCKLVCIDTDARSVVYVDFVNFDNDLPQYATENGVIKTDKPGLSEADPRMWIEALEMLFTKSIQNGLNLKAVKAISVSGQQHGLVALDKESNLTRKTSKLWNDFSTAEECSILTEKIGGVKKMIREIGNTQRPGYTASKIFHMYRHEPEIAAKTSTFFLVHNYINWFLTGGVRVMEPGDVSGMALRHPGKNRWSKKICDSISPELISKLPPVRSSDKMIGKISTVLADKFGFSRGCLIDAGCGDNMYGAIGTGNVKPGIITISLGTSGTAFTILEKPFVDDDGEIASFCDSTGKYMPLLCVSNMANGYNDILEQYHLSHDEFTKILSQTKAGNDGKFLIPWYTGERTPDVPNGVPVYWGFGLSDFTMPVLCRAVLEGHVLNFYDGFRRMPVKPDQIRLTGGLSRSESWQRMIADVFGIETVPVEGEGTALGAAIHAAWVYFKREDKLFPIENLTDSFVKLDERCRRKPENTAVYEHLRELFHAVSLSIRGKIPEKNPFDLADRFDTEFHSP